jgi:methionyl-tRNA synthetase
LKKYKRILVTSALPYANGPLHLGHIAGAYLPADIYVRYQKAKRRDVIYICGSDEHGVPITVTADKEKISPQKVVDRYHEMNKKSFNQLGIDFDNYSRTSIQIHHKTAQEFFNILNQKKELVIKNSKQFFSEKSKRFLPDRYVEGICPYCEYNNARGDQCDKCGKWLEPRELINPKSKLDGFAPVLKETKHWYFPMGRFAKEWKKWFDSQEWKENVRNYCIGWYKEGLNDRPITRDLHWGVPVPIENIQEKVLYVWFDAPIGYISSTKEWAENIGDSDRWKPYWCDPETKLVHFIGKDNIVFHAILFPMILKRVGRFILPSAIPANEYLTIEGRKISTSQNYAVWLKDYLTIFKPDPLRYVLALHAPETKDTDFSWKQFQSRNNDELADILGNFVNRTLTFIHRYYDGIVPEIIDPDDLDNKILKEIEAAPEKIGDLYENFEVRKATKAVMDLCRLANKYFNDKAPWETRTSAPLQCATTLNICIQLTKAITILIAPILPFSAQTLKKMLTLNGELYWDNIATNYIKAGHQLGKPEILFEKIEDELIQKEIEKLSRIELENNQIKELEKQNIDIEIFRKLDIRTAKILAAEKIKNTNRLLKIQIDLGNEERTIVAGIAESYKPDQIVGKTIIIVANLKSSKIRNIESHGMLLAVNSEEGFNLLTTDSDVPVGLPVS